MRRFATKGGNRVKVTPIVKKDTQISVPSVTSF